MTRTMADSDSADALPVGMNLYAAYVDGSAASGQPEGYVQAKARFPGKLVLSISVTGLPADVGDVERGALTIQQAIQIGYPMVYCSLSNWAAYINAFAAAHKPQPLWWVAGYETPPDPTIPGGAAAHQYTDGTGAYDTSSVLDYLPGIDPAPSPKPTLEEPPMLVIFQAVVKSGQYTGVLASYLSENLMRWRWIASPQQLADILDLAAQSGVPVTQHTPGTAVADVGAFGNPADPVSAAQQNLSFP